MIDKLTPKVLEYVKNDSIKALVLKGAGGKALCAGGDVAALASGISKNGNAGSVDATTFFRDEYILVQLIATLSKPYVALMHGITMGGGVGVSVHAPFRIATEKTLFAMPETDIGFFPDVGGTYFLSRLDGEIGTYLALTSARLRGYDVVSAGIATHYIPSDRLPALEKRLAEATTESSSKNQFELVNSVLNEFEVDAPKDYKFSLAGKTRKLIDRAFGKNTIQEVVTELENDGSEFALATKDIILARSPTSVAVTLQALRRGKKIGVSEALDKEYRLSENFMYHHDFVEGVSAKLISKPARKPQKKAKTDESEETTYETVELKECLDNFTASENVEYKCKSCGESTGAIKKVGFHTFPDVLVINARRFQIINWVPTKLDIPVNVSDEIFSLDKYLSIRPDIEEVVSDDEDEAEGSNQFVPNESALAGLEAMGFPRSRCEKALYHTGNSPDAEVAMNWLFAHMEDPDIDEPLVIPAGNNAGKSGSLGPSAEQIAMLQDMGFAAPQARKALRETSGNYEAAIEWLFNNPTDPGEDEELVDTIVEDALPESQSRGDASLPANYKLKAIICHKGRSIHAGHYVAFIRKPIGPNGEMEWVLFNDEKVVRGGEVTEMKKYAYIYVFERVK
ncbi:hypothetical protein D0Z03_002277 [Geotrichum reessii]|nr:hypothetical protein D0Z03_002277 [Galactomyces reessii]